MSELLKKGDKGEDVKELQKWLNSYGFDCGSADGIFGHNTENAVKTFQKTAGIPVDGVVGPQTRNTIIQMEKILGKLNLQIEEDGNTVLSDHFNNNTKGTVFGQVTYETSLPTLKQAANVTKSTYIKYTFTPWYLWDGVHDWNRHDAAPGILTQGTIEIWIKPRKYPARILNFNWGDATSYPESGHIMHFSVNENGKLGYGGWGGNFDKVPVGKRTIPLNKWTHVAVSWNPNGTKLYVNGLVDAYSNENCWPAFSGAVFAYLNYWGESDLGFVDELHISKVARTDKEIFCHAFRLQNIPGCRY